MSSEAPKRRIKYPYGKVRVYLSVIITVLSVILALLLLTPLLLLYYLGLTLVVTAVVLVLKLRFFYVRMPESEEKLSETERGKQRWKPLLVLAGVLILFMSLPLLLARFHPTGWFISLVSYMSGVSVAEVLVFLITRKS